MGTSGKQSNRSYESALNQQGPESGQRTTSPIVNENPETPDPQVKPIRVRRSYDKAYKMRILTAYGECPDAHARSAFLRREGLYYSCISTWRREFTNGKSTEESNKGTARIDHLNREIEQLKKKLSQAEAIIDLQKKVSDLFGQHIRSHDESEVTS